MANMLTQFLHHINQTRRNHALEHATIHLIGRKRPGKAFAGHSNPFGFILVGDANPELVAQTASEAMELLRQGNASLAIHEGCGTNYAISGGLAAVFALLATANTTSNQQRWSRFPLVMLLSLVAYLIGRSLGPIVQKKTTTNPHLGQTRLLSVSRIYNNVIWVHTSGS